MFFTYIDQQMTQGVDLTLVFRKNNGQLTVSALPKANGLKDEAQNHIVPLTLTGTPSELDAGFFAAISQPLQKATGLISNMAQFEKQANKAAANSKATKAVKDKEDKAAKDKKEKYDQHMKKADELITAENYKDAQTSLQQARLVATPEAIKTVDEKIKVVNAKLSQGSLFDMPEAKSAQPTPKTQQQPQQAAPSVSQEQPQQIQEQQQYIQPQMPYNNDPRYQQPYIPMPNGYDPAYYRTNGQQQNVQPTYSGQYQAVQGQQQMQQPQQMNGYQQSQKMPQYAQTDGINLNDPRYQPPFASMAYDPASCRPDEYDNYTDFHVNTNNQMSNNPNQTV